MRTSTVIFLLLFLCLFSSTDRRSQLGELFGHLRDRVHKLTDPRSGPDAEAAGVRSAIGSAVDESGATRALREELRELEVRSSVADKTLRAVDRSMRTLDDRIRKLESDLRQQPDFEELFRGSLSLLQRQRDELAGEKEEIQALKEQLRGRQIRVRSELDLAGIRRDRRQVEAFLEKERGSPLEKLALESRFDGR